MPTVLRKNGFQVRVYLNDHEPAHVHVVKGGGEARIQLEGENREPEFIEVYGMKDSEAFAALEIVAEHQSELLEKWCQYHDQGKSKSSRKIAREISRG